VPRSTVYPEPVPGAVIVWVLIFAVVWFLVAVIALRAFR